ncbi:GlsB/YeaQ/YmgE family stress response membrane protein [Streptomyces sp. NPDC052236]|uniref:GlsB/YeaQ/YmgE family stress response membrane protein n=1 Tax=Streptomyces sp. NPDC052236 TaxID=3365686 RepID=UPI0037D34025
MGVIAWIVLGLASGMVAKMLVPGRDSHGLIITTLIGIGGALLGGFLATQLFHIDSTQGFFNLSTWVTAIAGAAIVLFAFHQFEGRSKGRKSRRSGRRHGYSRR